MTHDEVIWNVVGKDIMLGNKVLNVPVIFTVIGSSGLSVFSAAVLAFVGNTWMVEVGELGVLAPHAVFTWAFASATTVAS